MTDAWYIFSRVINIENNIQTVDNFRFRWNNYKCNCYKHAKGEPVKQQHLYDHFMLEDHTQFVNDVSIIFIDKTDPTDPLKREQYWRHTLKTLVPYGLNVSESVWLHDICKLLYGLDCIRTMNLDTNKDLTYVNIF